MLTPSQLKLLKTNIHCTPVPVLDHEDRPQKPGNQIPIGWMPTFDENAARWKALSWLRSIPDGACEVAYLHVGLGRVARTR